MMRPVNQGSGGTRRISPVSVWHKICYYMYSNSKCTKTPPEEAIPLSGGARYRRKQIWQYSDVLQMILPAPATPASFLVKGGMSVRLYNGIPERPEDGDSAQAIVIALKSRTQETAQAVDDSLRAARFLLNQGARQLYFKYCSTFDSTPKGNIGP